MAVSNAMVDKKLQEGQEHCRLGEKCLKTGLLKWKPDLDGAVSEFGKAAVAFKNAKAYEKAAQCFIRVSDLNVENDSPFHAAKALESAAQVFKENKQPDLGIDLIKKACMLYLEHGVPDTAGHCLDRGAKMIEHVNPEQAIELYQKACEIADGEDKLRQCTEMIGKAARILIRTQQYSEAANALQKEIDYLSQVDQHHGQLYKLVYALVLVHLHRGDYVAADNSFSNAVQIYAGFCNSEEAPIIQRLLACYEDGDADGYTEAANNPLFRYMENDFTKLARDLVVPVGFGGSSKSGGSGGKPVPVEDEEFDLR